MSLSSLLILLNAVLHFLQRTCGHRISKQQECYSCMRSHAIFSHQSPIEITIFTQMSPILLILQPTYMYIMSLMQIEYNY